MTKTELFSKPFVARLIQLRGRKTKAEFACHLGLKSPTYFRYEAGRIPKPEILEAIAKRCEVSVEWLIGNESHTPKRDFDPALMAIPKDVHSRLLALKSRITRLETAEGRTRHHFCAAAESDIDAIIALCDALMEAKSRPSCGVEKEDGI